MALPYAQSDKPARRDGVPLDRDGLQHAPLDELALVQSQRLEDDPPGKVAGPVLAHPQAPLGMVAEHLQDPVQQACDIDGCGAQDEDEVARDVGVVEHLRIGAGDRRDDARRRLASRRQRVERLRSAVAEDRLEFGRDRPVPPPLLRVRGLELEELAHPVVDLDGTAALGRGWLDAEQEWNERGHGCTEEVRSRVSSVAVHCGHRCEGLGRGRLEARPACCDEVVRQGLFEQPLVVPVVVRLHVAEEAGRDQRVERDADSPQARRVVAKEIGRSAEPVHADDGLIERRPRRLRDGSDAIHPTGQVVLVDELADRDERERAGRQVLRTAGAGPHEPEARQRSRRRDDAERDEQDRGEDGAGDGRRKVREEICGPSRRRVGVCARELRFRAGVGERPWCRGEDPEAQQSAHRRPSLAGRIA